MKSKSICCPETSVINYQSTLCNIPEKRKSHLQQGRSLNSLNRVLLEKPIVSHTVKTFPLLCGIQKLIPVFERDLTGRGMWCQAFTATPDPNNDI